jgi:hypothetical protein
MELFLDLVQSLDEIWIKYRKKNRDLMMILVLLI